MGWDGMGWDGVGLDGMGVVGGRAVFGVLWTGGGFWIVGVLRSWCVDEGGRRGLHPHRLCFGVPIVAVWRYGIWDFGGGCVVGCGGRWEG